MTGARNHPRKVYLWMKQVITTWQEERQDILDHRKVRIVQILAVVFPQRVVIVHCQCVQERKVCGRFYNVFQWRFVNSLRDFRKTAPVHLFIKQSSQFLVPAILHPSWTDWHFLNFSNRTRNSDFMTKMHGGVGPKRCRFSSLICYDKRGFTGPANHLYQTSTIAFGSIQPRVPRRFGVHWLW